jgi:hypothetical protein
MVLAPIQHPEDESVVIALAGRMRFAPNLTPV